MHKSFFFLKVIICICLYFGFVIMKREDRAIRSYDSDAIEEMILSDFKPDQLYEIPVFHMLKDMI